MSDATPADIEEARAIIDRSGAREYTAGAGSGGARRGAAAARVGRCRRRRAPGAAAADRRCRPSAPRRTVENVLLRSLMSQRQRATEAIDMGNSRHEASIDVQATPEQVWDALANPEKTRGYYYGTDILSDWQPGSRWTERVRRRAVPRGRSHRGRRAAPIVQTFHVAIEEPAAATRRHASPGRSPLSGMTSLGADDPRGHGPGNARLRRGRLGAHSLIGGLTSQSSEA